MVRRSAHEAPPPQEKGSRLATARWVRILFVSTGIVSLALGIIGIVTPILPTTPFILLSGYCFARGSERFHIWISNHKYFGPIIRVFRDEKRIPLPAKLLATVMIITTMTLAGFIVKKPLPIIGMGTVGLGVLIYIWSFKN
ncbi:MAG: hypothetical protein LDLANPLL_02071 [Turneriella sp.]|nr:hypothetical protein [Turneriella sp.]